MPIYSLEYVIVLGLFIGMAPYAIDAQLERRKILKYERSYSQFLFEIADAMRGGLDPAKAVVELAKTNAGILKDNLKRASDSIRLGRPFNEVMISMIKPIKSDLIRRYATLIGETAKIGGDPAIVIHRAAKDMDDFIKVSQERRRQLATQTTTIYIAFGVLLLVLYQLISIFPNLGSIDISLLGAEDVQSAKASTITRMNPILIKQRFLDLLLINSIGTGTIIGSFIDGKIKYGLIHSLILVAVSVLFFVFLII
jgi:flagellar protein FlaJ